MSEFTEGNPDAEIPSITNQELTLEARRPIDEFLDSIERVLLANGTNRLERQAILQELESQILTLIERRREEGNLLDEGMIASILGGMDPASSYRQTDPSDPASESVGVESSTQPPGPESKPQFSQWPRSVFSRVPNFFESAEVGWDPLAWFSAGVATLGLLSLGAGRGEGALFGALAFLVSSATGAFSMYRILHSSGRLHGLSAAAFGSFAGPLVLLWAFLVVSRLWIPVCIASVLYFHYTLGMRLWRRLVRNYDPVPMKRRTDFRWSTHYPAETVTHHP